MIEVIKNAGPPPEYKRKPAKYLFSLMDVGDAFCMKCGNEGKAKLARKRIGVSAIDFAKNRCPGAGVKFVTRTIDGDVWCYRVA